MAHEQCTLQLCLKRWGHQADLSLRFRYKPTRCCYQGSSYEVPSVWWKSDSNSMQQPSHRKKKKNHVFRLFGFDGYHTNRLLKYVTVLFEVNYSSWHLKCARQKHEIYHPSIKMRSRGMWKKWEADQQCFAAELVILQVSSKEDITVNLFRNNTVQE